MLGRVIAAVVFTLAVSATASAQDVKLPEIDFGRRVGKVRPRPPTVFWPGSPVNPMSVRVSSGTRESREMSTISARSASFRACS